MKIAIVGGGVAGLATGWRLAQRGAEVCVIERGEPGAAATRAAAGMIAVVGETADSPRAEVKFAKHASGLWPSFASELEAASGARIAYLQNGALLVANAGESAVEGDGVSPIALADARVLEPMLTGEYPAIAWAPGEAQVDNRALGPALAHAFQKSGGRILREEVLALELNAANVTGVRTSTGRVSADVVVVAAGAWSSHVDGIPAELRAVRPVKGEMIALAGSGGQLSRVVRSADAYLVPRGPNVFVGATMEDVGFDTRLNRNAADRLHRAAAILMPALASWSIAEHWTGFRPGSPDGLPIVGPTSVQGLFAATGQFRNGILFAPALAELVSQAVLDGASVPDEFNPRRFATGAGACTP